MNFLNPAALYLSLLIGVLLLLYFLKLKRQTHAVSSVILWKEEVEDLKADTPFQRLKASAILCLQILFLIFGVSALARPFIKGAPSAHGKLILIIDNSASMNSEDEKPNRLEAAKSEAKRVIQTLKADDQMSIIAAGSIPRRISNFLSNRNQLYEALKEISPTDSDTNLKEAVALGMSILSQEAGTILIFSDSVADLSQLPAKNRVKFLVQTFGKRSYNIAITSFDVRLSADSKRYEAFVKVHNFYESEKKVDLSLHLGPNYELLDVKSVKLAPNSVSQAYFVFDNIGYKMTPLKVQIDINDDLKSDNAAYAILNQQERIKILLVSEGNRFLEEALKSQTQVDIIEIAPSRYLESTNYDYDNYDIVVFDSFVPTKLPQVNALFINPTSNLSFMTITSETQNPSVIQVNLSHPIMRFVAVSDLKIAKSLVYEMPPWGLALVESENAPLIWIGENENRRGVFITFDLNQSDLPLKTAFPILISNVLNWLSETKQILKRQNLIVGSPIKIGIRDSGFRARGIETPNQIQLIDPNGRIESMKVQNGTVLSKETKIAGIYEVRSKGKMISRFAVNLLDESESNTKPTFASTVGEVRESPLQFQNIWTHSRAPLLTNFSHKMSEFYNFLLTAAISILAIEWWVYNKTNKERKD